MKGNTRFGKRKLITFLTAATLLLIPTVVLTFGKTLDSMFDRKEAVTDAQIIQDTQLSVESASDVTGVSDINALKEKYYWVNNNTKLEFSDFPVDKFLNEDLSIHLDGDKPKILIFHTHSSEMYSDSDGKNSGVIGVGEKLKEELEQQYGIPTIHNTTAFDFVDGELTLIGAYERMEVEIKKILEENPSIEIVIDLHRDGVANDTKLITTINSKPTAQISFVNGLSKVYKDGNLEELDDLANEYVYDNLAFSFNMLLLADQLYPTYVNKVHVLPYRYSLHMIPKSLLIEVGAQTNTQLEAENAVPILAEILAKKILK